jgi:hypothetical protein
MFLGIPKISNFCIIFNEIFKEKKLYSCMSVFASNKSRKFFCGCGSPQEKWKFGKFCEYIKTPEIFWDHSHIT